MSIGMATSALDPSLTHAQPPSDTELSDAELVERVRDGDLDAYGVLWARHVNAVTVFARHTSRRDAEDLVAESYTRVLVAIRSGRGPTTAFRAYLFSTVRRTAIDTIRRHDSRYVVTDQVEVLDRPVAQSPEDEAIATALGQNARQALASLPDESRTLLWDLIVHEQTPARIAGHLGLSPNAVASRAKRARELLRVAFLSALAAPSDALSAGPQSGPECRPARRRFGAYVRNTLPGAAQIRLEEHLAGCGRCRDALDQLRTIEATIRPKSIPPATAIATRATPDVTAHKPDDPDRKDEHDVPSSPVGQ